MTEYETLADQLNANPTFLVDFVSNIIDKVIGSKGKLSIYLAKFFFSEAGKVFVLEIKSAVKRGLATPEGKDLYNQVSAMVKEA